jgi:hypothetical protein
MASEASRLSSVPIGALAVSRQCDERRPFDLRPDRLRHLVGQGSRRISITGGRPGVGASWPSMRPITTSELNQALPFQYLMHRGARHATFVGTATTDVAPRLHPSLKSIERCSNQRCEDGGDNPDTVPPGRRGPKSAQPEGMKGRSHDAVSDRQTRQYVSPAGPFCFWRAPRGGTGGQGPPMGCIESLSRWPQHVLDSIEHETEHETDVLYRASCADLDAAVRPSLGRLATFSSSASRVSSSRRVDDSDRAGDRRGRRKSRRGCAFGGWVRVMLVAGVRSGRQMCVDESLGGHPRPASRGRLKTGQVR